MAPVARVSDENFKRIKRFAEPLEDTFDDVLGRVLDMAERQSLGSSTDALETGRRSGARIVGVNRRFARDILEVLRDHGGTVPTEKVFDELARRLKDELRTEDWKRDPTGQIVWRHRVHATKRELKVAGLIEDVATRRWKITDAALEELV